MAVKLLWGMIFPDFPSSTVTAGGRRVVLTGPLLAAQPPCDNWASAPGRLGVKLRPVQVEQVPNDSFLRPNH